MTYSTTRGIASRAKRARHEAGVTIDTLAQGLGVSYSTMRRRLEGTHAWDSDDIVKAAVILKVSPDYLLLGERGAA